MGVYARIVCQWQGAQRAKAPLSQQSDRAAEQQSSNEQQSSSEQ